MQVWGRTGVFLPRCLCPCVSVTGSGAEPVSGCRLRLLLGPLLVEIIRLLEKVIHSAAASRISSGTSANGPYVLMGCSKAAMMGREEGEDAEVGMMCLSRYHLGEDERCGQALGCWRLLEEPGMDRLTLQPGFIAVWKAECLPHPGSNPGTFYLCFFVTKPLTSFETFTG